MSSRPIFAISGIIGTALGPMSPGTAYVLLHHYMGEVDGSVGAWGYARGGMGAITKALSPQSFQASGGTIRTGAEVDKVLVKNGRATGVVLADGEEIRGKLVISNADVKRTFLKLVEEKELPENFLRRVQELQDPRLVRQGQHRARFAAGIPGAAEGLALHPRRPAFHRFRRAHGARL